MSKTYTGNERRLTQQLTDAIEVIANVTDLSGYVFSSCVHSNIHELCVDHQSSTCTRCCRRLHSTTQISLLFLFHQSKSIRSVLEDFSIELEHRTESHKIIDDSSVERITLFDTCNSGSISVPQDRVEAFINQHCSQSAIAFADGSTTEEGRGSSAVILMISRSAEAPLDETSHFFGSEMINL